MICVFFAVGHELGKLELDLKTLKMLLCVLAGLPQLQLLALTLPGTCIAPHPPFIFTHNL